MIESVEDKVLEMVRIGSKESPMSGSEIARKLGIESPDVRMHIYNLRERGFCEIVSNSRGYWWTENLWEIKECEKRLTKRALKQLRTVGFYRKRLLIKSDPLDLFKQAKELKLI